MSPIVKALCYVTFEISHLIFITHSSIYHNYFIDEQTGAQSKLKSLAKVTYLVCGEPCDLFLIAFTLDNRTLV